MHRRKICDWSARISIFAILVLTFTIITGNGMAFGNQNEVAVTTVIVMRHAEKASSEGDPDLTKEGEERAQHLKEVLGWLPISAVFSTPTKRAMQTAQPLAKCLGFTDKELNIYKTIPQVLEKINSSEFRGKTVFVMGHMGTAQDLINLLGGTGLDCPGVNHDEICVTQIMPDKKIQVLRLKYGKILEPVTCKQQ